MMSDKLDLAGEAKVTGRYYYSRDHTHTNKSGAGLNARTVTEGIKTLRNCELANYLTLETLK